MANYILSERARKGLLDIGNYTKEKWSEEQAERYVLMILTECKALADSPLAGRSYEPYRPGLLGKTCGKHVIFYRILPDNRVRIVRVLHERMDFLRYH